MTGGHLEIVTTSGRDPREVDGIDDPRCYIKSNVGGVTRYAISFHGLWDFLSFIHRVGADRVEIRYPHDPPMIIVDDE